MSRYIMWDHVSPVITPSGEVFTAQDWEDRYPAAQLIPYVMSGGDMNGALMQSYGSMKSMYEKMGCDFTGLADGQAVLDKIEQFEDAQEEAAAEEAERRAEEEAEAAAAAEELALREIEALEDIAVYSMPDA